MSDDNSSVGNSQRMGGLLGINNISMASPTSANTSMADFSMASISQGDMASSDQNNSSHSDDSDTEVVKVEKKK